MEGWDDVAGWVERCGNLPAVVANAELLGALEPRWRGHVVARTSMHDLLFTCIGEPDPFSLVVRIAWTDEVFDMRLLKHDSLLVTGDRCGWPNAVAVDTSLLLQLAEEDELLP